ncbi:MarR family EPS-associated transcriptional regulator [Orrella marina]|uniref:MarR family EPS-associated transcriptional regulator n=1 Tax=Orrella marina TaxID=2163011 RepID=A0A2R4XGV0_9BURK|nr:MarR family EPS-associated transcriptional regulator [Orrella marina]AWB33047.1 MarR family EPS-associated transcriptional regulator [Orrella marina]
MPSRQIRIKEDTDFRILRILQQNPEISQRDLAKELGMSLGGLNYCLKALIDKGFVKLSNYQNSQHKLKYVYILTPSGLAQKISMTGRFLRRKMQEYEVLQAEINDLSLEIGETAPLSGSLDIERGLRSNETQCCAVDSQQPENAGTSR